MLIQEIFLVCMRADSGGSCSSYKALYMRYFPLSWVAYPYILNALRVLPSALIRMEVYPPNIETETVEAAHTAKRCMILHLKLSLGSCLL